MKTIAIEGYIGEYPNTVEVINLQLLSIGSMEQLNITINSKGGSYPEALMIYDRINRHKGKKRVRISPMAASAGAVIALLPDAEVTIPKNGLLRHHMPMVMGSDPRNSEELEAQAEQLKAIEQTLVDTVVAKCGKTEKYVRALLNEDKWLTADQALELGLVDKVLPLSRDKVNITNLVLPEEIVAHVGSLNLEINTMELKDVCNKVEIEVVSTDTDDVLGDKIVNHVGVLLTTIQDLTKERDELKEGAKKPEFPERIVNILVREREGEIDRLVSEGRITGAVAKGLKKQFAGKDEIVNCVDEEGNPKDGFDGLISSLNENEKVINFGDQRKKAALEKTGSTEETNPVIADAIRREEEARR
jgi:ATP-dependent protease ClpP protease subunit/hydrogenase maturation factor